MYICINFDILRTCWFRFGLRSAFSKMYFIRIRTWPQIRGVRLKQMFEQKPQHKIQNAKHKKFLRNYAKY